MNKLTFRLWLWKNHRYTIKQTGQLSQEASFKIHHEYALYIGECFDCGSRNTTYDGNWKQGLWEVCLTCLLDVKEEDPFKDGEVNVNIDIGPATGLSEKREYQVVEFEDATFYRFDEDDWWLYIEGDLERYQEDDLAELEEAYREIYSQMVIKGGC
jgi:hypothetical protein